MAVREIILIDEEKCDGCGDCVLACAEGAIQVIDGKARLINDSFCDGMGACLGDCPQGALTIVKREAPNFDQKAVDRFLAAKAKREAPKPAAAPAGCPGAAMREMVQGGRTPAMAGQPSGPSQLGHWPIQLMLVPPHAPFLKGADLVICADCVPFTVPDFHRRYLAGRAIVVACPKLDDLQFYFGKLKELFAEAQPRRITVLRMEVPCCGGIAQAAVQACNEVAPQIPVEVHTIGIQGEIQEEEVPAAGQQTGPAFNMVG